MLIFLFHRMVNVLELVTDFAGLLTVTVLFSGATSLFLTLGAGLFSPLATDLPTEWSCRSGSAQCCEDPGNLCPLAKGLRVLEPVGGHCLDVVPGFELIGAAKYCIFITKYHHHNNNVIMSMLTMSPPPRPWPSPGSAPPCGSCTCRRYWSRRQ